MVERILPSLAYKAFRSSPTATNIFSASGKILAGVVPVVKISEVDGMIQELLRRPAVLWPQWQGPNHRQKQNRE
jgi:hypothetical protein